MDNDLVNRLKDTISTNTMNINDVTDLGFNFRMSSLQAVLATEQLQRWPEIHARRMACYQDYIDTFADMKDIRLQSHRHNSVLSPWGFPVQFMEEETHCQAKCSIVSALKREGIDARPMFFPIDAILAQLNLSVPNITSCMVSRKIHESSIVLPLHAQMARRDIRRIRLIIEKCLRNSRK
jgi:dTDP-4-amino-4,6-dideoxygalactose transaminase